MIGVLDLDEAIEGALDLRDAVVDRATRTPGLRRLARYATRRARRAEFVVDLVEAWVASVELATYERAQRRTRYASRVQRLGGPSDSRTVRRPIAGSRISAPSRLRYHARPERSSLPGASRRIERRPFGLSVPQKIVFDAGARYRFRCIVCGRRFGKTYLACYELLRAALARPKSLCWYLAPTYGMAREIAWDILVDLIPTQYVRRVSLSRLTITLKNGSRITLRGAEKAQRLRGRSLWFVVLDEFADLPAELWPDVIRPSLADLEGSALFCGTPKGHNWAFDLFEIGRTGFEKDGTPAPEWRSWQFRTIDGGRVKESELASARRNSPPAIFAQEYLASFTKLTGRIYSSFSSGSIDAIRAGKRSGNLDPRIVDTGGTLYVGMDFNVNPMTAIVAVRVGRELHVLEALEVETSNTDEIARELKARYPNRYIVVCPDPAGRARHTSVDLETTDFTILQAHGFYVNAPAKSPYWTDRINATNAAFQAGDGTRRIFVHPRATALTKALDGYVYKREKDGRSTSLPDKSGGHDHVTDALGYLVWMELNDLLPDWTVSTFR